MGATVDVIAERLTDSRELVYCYVACCRSGRWEGGYPSAPRLFACRGLDASECGGPDSEDFQAAIELVNGARLFSDEVDPATGELIGNVPQAFSCMDW